MTVHDLPAVNATLNGLSAVFLVAGFVFIKRGNKIAHRNCMVSAFVTSVIFLGCYLTYHATVKTVTHFVDPAWFRPIYLAILATHTLLAAAIVPLILMTLWRAKKENFEAHKKIARWTWPLWLYVSVTGVVIYLLLYQIFPQVK
jgi:putative membrane protein